MSKLDVYHEKDDLTAFVILTDQNLEKLGVFFGHRRKMLCAIAALVAHRWRSQRRRQRRSLNQRQSLPPWRYRQSQHQVIAITASSLPSLPEPWSFQFATWIFWVVLAAAAQSITEHRPSQTSPDTSEVDKARKEIRSATRSISSR